MVKDILAKITSWHSERARYEPELTTVFAWILWENFAYLARPAQKFEAWQKWLKTVGIQPADILNAEARVKEITTQVGILPQNSRAKLRKAAELALDRWQGDPEQILSLENPSAIRALRQFPSIGLPGAEKILLFLGKMAVLAPESNALRVMQRVGWVSSDGTYATQYQRAKEFAAQSLPKNIPKLQVLHRQLKFLGQTVCKAKRPLCSQCPLDSLCPKSGVPAEV